MSEAPDGSGCRRQRHEPAAAPVGGGTGNRGAAVSRLLAIGGAHLDRRGRLSGLAVAGASNPGRFVEEPGGSAFNAARLLARLGHVVGLVAPRGGDAAGRRVAEAAEAAGLIDMPVTFLDRQTPSYTAILEPSGELVIALADMALYDLFGPRQIARRLMRERIDAAEAVIADANLPEATLSALCETCRSAGRPLYGIAVSPAKVPRFRPCLGGLSGLFMNAAEAGALLSPPPTRPLTVGKGAATSPAASWPTALAEAGLAAGVVTAGAASAIAFDRSGVWSLTPPAMAAPADVTGAGDALAAGFIDALLNGGDAPAALRRGTALAGLSLQSNSVLPAIDEASLDAALATVASAERLPAAFATEIERS